MLSKHTQNSQTLVFIDDSGDAGFKFERGSSKIFVIAAVIFDDPLEAEKVAVAIKEFRRSIGFPDTMEFKFNKSNKKVRLGFMNTINVFAFKVRTLVIDKTILHSDELKNDKNSFYSYSIKMLLKPSDMSILEAKIKLDGSGDRAFRRNFSSYLRKSLNSNGIKVISNLKFSDSKDNVLIQLADMIAGSIRRSYEGNKQDGIIYKKIIRKHIEDEWRFK